MDELNLLGSRFEAHRARLRALAYRMLGSTSDADDAVQDSWIRLSRTPPGSIDDLGGWLTTVTARVCLTMLSARARKPMQPIESHADPIVTAADGPDPEQEALLGDAVGAALMVVLGELAPAERVAFVLHDLFAVPFGQIATILDRSAPSVRQLASRARRRIRGAEPPAADRTHDRTVVDAFFAAARSGDFAALLRVLDPDVALRTDQGTGGSVIMGADQVAGRALLFAAPDRVTTPALVDGGVGVLVRKDGQLVSIMKFTVDLDVITAITAFIDPDRLRRVDLNAIGG